MSNPERSITRSEKQRKNGIFFKPKKIVLLIFLLLITPYLSQIQPVFSVTIHVPTDYGTIQAAVDNATAGDTIQVAPGIYYEHVVVNKSLTIVGENPQTTIVDGTANGTVFYLEGSNIYISGFTIRNAGNNSSGIASEKEIVTSDYHMISSNIITTSLYGVYLSSSDRNTIFNNTLINNGFGAIFLTDADNTNITANTIAGGAYGIRTLLSLNNIIIGNTISQTSYAIYLSLSSTGNTIRNNVLSGQTASVYSNSDSTTVDHNTLIGGSYGTYFYNSESGSIYYNTFMNNSYGIRIYMPTSATSSHTISNNKILYTDWAIELVSAHGNTFTGNWIQQNTWGIYMTSSSSNTAYRNNFVDNFMQAYAGTGTGNNWDKNVPGEGRQGNYWSDYTGEDENPRDGIGDTPYRITPIGSDNYPLMDTWSEHDVSIENVTLSTNETYVGSIVDINVTVKNKGKLGMSETFNLTVKYDTNTIETKTVVNLAAGANQSLTFKWNTTGVVPGSNYTISARASTVPDELNTENNNFVDGTVEVDEIVVFHDVAAISVASSATEVYAGEMVNVTVVVKNEGTVDETFNVTAYYDDTAIGTKKVTDLAPEANMTLAFTWNTTGVSPGNYTISATAEPVYGETDLTDNTFIDGMVEVMKLMGDVDGDGDIDLDDLYYVMIAYGTKDGDPDYNPAADIDNDGEIDLDDLYYVLRDYGYP